MANRLKKIFIENLKNKKNANESKETVADKLSSSEDDAEFWVCY